MQIKGTHYCRENKEVLKTFTGVQKEELGGILDKRRLIEINNFLQRKKKDKLRNLTIFYLAVCYGIERRQLCQLQWSQVKWEESIEAENLGAYLTSEEIYAQAKKKLDKKREIMTNWHPMEKVLEGVLL